MKVSINQVNVSRVGINTARIQRIRLGSASKGGQTSPFHPSLVDYWSFKGKSNFDKDRNTIKGIKGNILNAYNFGWSLGSGYGLYKINFLKDWSNTDRYNGQLTSDSIKIENMLLAGSIITVIERYGSQMSVGEKFSIPSFKVKVKVSGNSYFRIHVTNSRSDDGDVILADLKTTGEYTIPAYETIITKEGGILSYRISIVNSVLDTYYGFSLEQIPQYEGAIVTDGIDDYLKLDKVGYKIGTVIIKYKAIPWDNQDKWGYIFDINKERMYAGYQSKEAINNNVVSNNFLNNKLFGDYRFFRQSVIKTAETPLFLSTKSINLHEALSMALYKMAIYSEILTDEEIQKEIKVMGYGTPNPVFALNFDNFAYKAVDYPEFATGKVTTNKIVVDSTTKGLSGELAIAISPSNALDPIEVPSYKIKVTGLNQYSVGEGNWVVGLMGMMIDSTEDPWTYPISKDGVYDIPAISLSDGICNLVIVTQVEIDNPIEIEILYDKNVTKSFPENKQIFP